MVQLVVGRQLWTLTKMEGKGIPIVFMHGWGRTSADFLGVAKYLSQVTRRPVYLIDLPGFGGSSLPIIHSITQCVELIEQLFAYLKFKKVTLIGHSLGGRMGILLAARNPQLMHRLVLIDPAGVKHFSLWRSTLKFLAKIFRFVPVSWRRKLMGRLMDEDYRNTPGLRDMYRAIVAEDLRPYLAKIKCRTSVIWGEYDALLPLYLVDFYREEIRDVVIRVVWGAGHDPHLTHPRELMRILEEVEL